MEKEKKVFGYSQTDVKKLTEAYLKSPEPLALNGQQPISSEPFWSSVHSGTKKLVEERPDLTELV